MLPATGEPMSKHRYSKFALIAALFGGMAILLACLLCWIYGWNPVWAGSLNLQPGAAIGDAEISEPPVIPSRTAEKGVTPPVAAPAQKFEPEAPQDSGAASSHEAAPQPEPENGQQAEQHEQQDGRQDNADSSVHMQTDAETPNQPPAQETSKTAGASASSATGKAPATGATAARPSKVQLFGTVEFKRPLSTLPGWLDLLKRNQMSPIFIPGKVFKKNVAWENFRAKAPANSKMELLRYVNSFWNTWPYIEDSANWRQEDYWEIPAEFLKKSGDCEDYSIIKYFTLKELGIPPETMRIVVVRDTIRNFAHAVLVVYLNDDAFVLDNLSNSVLSHTRVRQYSPQYSVNEFGRWAHMKGRKLE